ncbi:MAG: hypothetical protein QXT17_09845, partial [Thermofilum sp.]|uniref:hypothetical protein n=1 Tax=Thermofilum sp. TaxID=1961369 RepID=UPI00317DEAB6
ICTVSTTIYGLFSSVHTVSFQIIPPTVVPEPLEPTASTPPKTVPETGKHENRTTIARIPKKLLHTLNIISHKPLRKNNTV